MASDSWGKLLVLSTAAASGIAVFFNSFAVQGGDPLVFTALKNAICAMLLSGIALSFGTWKEFAHLHAKQWGTLLLIAIIGGSLPFALFFTGLSMSDGATGSFIYRALFFAAAAFAFVFLKEKVGWNVIVGVIVLMAVNILLLGKIPTIGTGEILVLAATILWAAESVVSKRALETISPQAVATARMLFGSLILLGALVALGKAGALFSSSISLTDAAISALLLFIYVMTWYRALAKIAVSEATAILAAGGIVSAVLSLAFLGKAPSAITSIYLMLTAAAVALVLGASPIRQAFETVRGMAQKRPVLWKD